MELQEVCYRPLVLPIQHFLDAGCSRSLYHQSKSRRVQLLPADEHLQLVQRTLRLIFPSNI